MTPLCHTSAWTDFRLALTLAKRLRGQLDVPYLAYHGTLSFAHTTQFVEKVSYPVLLETLGTMMERSHCPGVGSLRKHTPRHIHTYTHPWSWTTWKDQTNFLCKVFPMIQVLCLPVTACEIWAGTQDTLTQVLHGVYCGCISFPKP